MADRVGQYLGNYQLLRLLGRGAFAEVYLAEHRYLEVPAAIKVLHVRVEPDTQEQFLREARTIAHLQHPHIVRVLDFGFQDETPYLVMEYTPNGTLRARHPKGTCLSLEQIIHYIQQIAPALDYAHQQRVIHRDIKPENLLLNVNDEVVLSDFGLAVVQPSRETLMKQNLAGTPIYMAPEQIQGKPTPASDQYALGVLVYEWLCGEPPFKGTLYEVYSQHLHEPPPSLCERVPSLPLAVEDAVFGALAKEPHARFVNVQEFAEVLEEVRDTTQSLAVSLSSVASLPPEPFSPPEIMPLPAQALSLPEQLDHSTSTTPTLVLTRKQTIDREKQAAALQQRGIPRLQTNRQRLLRKVRAYWIAGVLEHSLYGNALIVLGLEEQPDAIANPWQLVLHHPTGAPRSLPAGTQISKVYDAADGELLILGAPGSGKTTLLLELTRDLLERAEFDEQHPMPIVFNLASWASEQMPLADWLVEELKTVYQVPRKLGKALVGTEQILPLLDGLDEVVPKARTACIKAINSYRQEHGLLPLVVCSRSADYLAQEARVQLGSAVAVQPLTQQQVDDFLVRGGEPLQGLRLALRQDAALRELTSRPLMLSLLTVTYQGLPAEDLLRETSLTNRQRQVFEHYVERMLRRRGAEMPYTPEQTKHWLSWLAREMQGRNQTFFSLESLQPDWLPTRRRALYQWTIRLGLVLAFVLVGVLIFGLAGEQMLGLGVGLGVGLGIVLGVRLDSRIEPVEALNWSREKLSISLSRGLAIGLVGGVSLSLASGLISGLAGGPGIGLSIGLLFGAIGMVLGLGIGLVGGLSVGLVGGFSRKQLSNRLMLSPNEGIRRSAKNGLVMMVGVLVSGLILGFGIGLVIRSDIGLGMGLDIGLALSLVSGLVFGLGAALQHFILRFWLSRAHTFPWKAVPFLEGATARILLQRVGGGYSFIHRLLLDYFADLNTEAL